MTDENGMKLGCWVDWTSCTKSTWPCQLAGSTRMNLVDVDTDREDKQVGRQVNKARASGADADQRRGQKNTMLKRNKI